MSKDVEEYLMFPAPYFCGWEVDGSAIVWSDGRTIVFREELLGLLRGLNAKRLPPLGALALMLAACRDNWREPPLRRELVWGSGYELEPSSAAARHFETIFRALDELNATWSEIRGDPLAKVRIAAAAFCDGRLDNLFPAVDPLAVLRRLSGEPPTDPPAGPRLQQRLLNDLRVLSKALVRLDSKVLSTRIATGLDQLVLPAPEPLALPPGGTVRDLLREIENDDELSGVARLARMLLAAVDLPRAVSDPDEFAQGGVSDIANRGELDRLLLSELAHDDMTLAVRVAMREALYLRREVPPRAPPHRRVVLVDCGLRMWGVPRVFAASVALALAATGDERIEVQAFRSAGDLAAASDFTTRPGLVEHLAALDHRAHPGAALAALVADLRRDADAPPADLALVTCEESLADRAFQRMLESLDLPSIYLATVDRQGELRVQERTPCGRRMLRRATLNLEEILEDRPGRKDLKHADREDLPAILTVEPFPLLLPHTLSTHRAWEAGLGGVLQLAKDGRLLLWTDPKHGAWQLAQGLGDGRVLWASPELVNAKSIAVFGKLSPRGLRALTYDPVDHEVQVRELEHSIERPLGVTGQGSTVFVFDADQINALDSATGELRGHCRLRPETLWMGQRFFFRCVPEKWSVVSFDGTLVHLTDVSGVPANCEKLIESRGREGFTAVTNAGELIHLDTGWKRLLASTGTISQVEVLAVARDGLRFAATASHDFRKTKEVLLVYPLNGHTQQLIGPPEEVVEPALRKYANNRSVRQRFESIARDPAGRLLLGSRKGQFWTLGYDDKQRTIVLGSRALDRDATLKLRPIRFEYLETAEDPWPLRMAAWPEGSRAYLDPRGLLHLRSSNTDIPECTIVLATGETAGWVADGRRWGQDYFLGKGPRETAEVIHREVLRPFVERLT